MLFEAARVKLYHWGILKIHSSNATEPDTDKEIENKD